MEKLIDFDRKMEKTEKKKYPIGPEHYTLYEEIGHGVSASVHRALCMPLNDVVAVKILDCERDNVDLNNISREAQTMILVDHPNVLKSHCSFVADHTLWVVMPYMAGGSCLHILKAAHPDGFEEVIIATILREVLRGLEYLHQHGHIHRDVKAGNILIDSHGTVKLGDFGVSACLFESGDRQRMRNTFVGTPCWMAPEVMEQLHGYDCKADIWSFGITALELAHGHAPFSKYPPMKVLLMTLQNAPPGLDYERDRKFSKSFKQMIASCLVKDPSKRPSAKKLLKHSFFKQARSNDYLLRILLEGLPALGERVKALKKKEEYLLAQKKMPDGEKEELSQNEYKRGISSWNFDLEDVKAQASLIPDDDTVFDKDQGGSSFKMDNPEKQLEHQFSAVGNITQTSDAEENEQIAHQPSPVSLVPSPSSCTEMIFEKSDDIASISCSNHDQTTSKYSPPESQRGNAELGDIEATASAMDHGAIQPHCRRASLSVLNDTSDIISPGKAERSCKQSSGDGGIGAQLLDEGQDIIQKSAKASSANNDEVKDEARVPVIQQKGRFKVTSENVDLEKVAPSPILHKSHSMQVGNLKVMGQHPTNSLPAPSDTLSTHVFARALFPLLQSFLQTNTTQRESILNLMKQISSGEFSGDGICTPANMAAAEKSVLETAHDREKELLYEITELQWRLICAQEELQKLKSENAQVNP